MDELAALGVAMPEDYKKEHAMVGEWETVRVIETAVEEEVQEDDAEGGDGVKAEDEGTEIVVAGGNTRNADDPNGHEDEDEEETRRFKVRTKEYPVDDGVEGLDDLLGKGKIDWKGKKRGAAFGSRLPVKEESPAEGGTDDKKEEVVGTNTDVKLEPNETVVKEDESGEAAPAPTVGFAFKKRKTKNNQRSVMA